MKVTKQVSILWEGFYNLLFITYDDRYGFIVGLHCPINYADTKEPLTLLYDTALKIFDTSTPYTNSDPSIRLHLCKPIFASTGNTFIYNTYSELNLAQQAYLKLYLIKR